MKRRLSSLAGVLVAMGSFALVLAPRPANAQGAQNAPADRPAQVAAPGQPAPPAKPPEISFVVRKFVETPAEGPDVERTYFLVGYKRVAFGMPRNCRLLGGEDFRLTPEDGSDSEIQVTRSVFTPESNFAKEAVRYHDVAVRGLPQEVEGENPTAPVMDPYPFNGWKSMGFTWSYSLYGRSVVRNVSFINLDLGVQIMVTTVASKSDAPKIEKLAKQFLSSWWVMRGS